MRNLLLAACAAATLFLPNLAGQEREAESIRERIETARQEMQRLQAEGKTSEAEALGRRIRAFQERARAAQATDRPPTDRGPDDLRRILHGLEQGMEALHALERREELAALERVAHDVRRRLEESTRRNPGQDARAEAGEDRERRVARATIEALHHAREAIAQAGRRDSVELIERAIAAREMNLQGRRDDEAQAIRERAPDHAAETELLSWGARLLHEQGKPDRAEAVARIAEQFQARYRRGQEAKRAEAPPRERARPDALDERLRRMEEAIEQLGRQLEELRRQRIR